MKNIVKIAFFSLAFQDFSQAITHRYLFPLPKPSLEKLKCPSIEEADWVLVGLNDIDEDVHRKEGVYQCLRTKVSYVWETCGVEDKNCRASLSREAFDKKSGEKISEVSKILPINKKYKPINDDVVCCHFFNIANLQKNIVGKKVYCNKANFKIPQADHIFKIYLEN